MEGEIIEKKEVARYGCGKSGEPIKGLTKSKFTSEGAASRSWNKKRRKEKKAEESRQQKIMLGRFG